MEPQTNLLQVNEATLSALEAWFSQQHIESNGTSGGHSVSQPATVRTGTALRRLALNNCAINGREAARLVRALGGHANVHLHISGNPLEDGIEDFCRAISLTAGPAGLHMDMLEFRREANFVALMKALTCNRKLSHLSLAGTAPTPSADGPCGNEVCDALRGFFEGNKSVKYLDLSGYSGRLDEGQLGQGFAQSLRGLVSNDSLTHLRIRNQNLHDDVGTLGSMIRQNSTLRIVDCQDNNWNLTSFQFLTKSLKLNHSIVHFPFPQKEYERVWSRVRHDLRRQSVVSKAAVAAHQETALRTALQRQVQELHETIQRNCDALGASALLAILEGNNIAESEEDSGRSRPKEPSKPGNDGGRGGKIFRHPLSMSHSKSAARQQQRQPLQVQPPNPSPVRLLDLDLDSDLMITPVDPPVLEITRRVHEISLPLSMVTPSDAVDAVDAIDVENPYHVGRDADALKLLETPPGASSLNEDDVGRSSPTTSEAPISPTTPPPETPLELSSYHVKTDGHTEPAVPGDSGFGGSASGSSPRITSGFDTGTYFGGFGRGSAASRFRIGGLEAHEEE